MNTKSTSSKLSALASHLRGRREAILEAWREAVEKDPDLTTGSSLSRTQFNDHVPHLLDLFARRLEAAPGEIDDHAQEQEHQGMSAHGLHRWQQGFRLRELTLEWGHLQLCVINEVEAYATDNPDLEPAVISTALRTLTHMCIAGVSESATQYWNLHQNAAAGHVRDLEQALATLNELEMARAAAWHGAAHDLRGSLSVVTTASQLLRRDVPETLRVEFTEILQRGVSSLHDMLNELIDLARLEAGHEKRTVAPFDAAVLLSDLCVNLQPLADDRGLFLKYEGPPSLQVEGDRGKVQRILQNLVLNALKYTQKGGIVVGCQSSAEKDFDRWMLCVQDTGPGFSNKNLAPIASQIKEGTQKAHEVEEIATTNGSSSNQDEPAATLPSQSAHPLNHQGEGIGLSIVKGLCDLLDATLELATESGHGSTFRVTFPCHYPNRTPPSP